MTKKITLQEICDTSLPALQHLKQRVENERTQKLIALIIDNTLPRQVSKNWKSLILNTDETSDLGVIHTFLRSRSFMHAVNPELWGRALYVDIVRQYLANIFYKISTKYIPVEDDRTFHSRLISMARFRTNTLLRRNYIDELSQLT